MKKYILFLFLISCGSRKAEKINQKEVILNDSKLVKNNDIIIQSNEKFTKLAETNDFIIEPIDTSKEFVFNGNVIKNAKVRIIKSKVFENKIKDEKITDKTKQTNQEKKQRVTHTKAKQIEREHSIFQYWWVALIIIVLFVYNKYKQKTNIW